MRTPPAPGALIKTLVSLKAGSALCHFHVRPHRQTAAVNVMLIAVVVIPDSQRTVSGCQFAVALPVYPLFEVSPWLSDNSGCGLPVRSHLHLPASYLPVAVTVGVKGGISAVERIFRV